MVPRRVLPASPIPFAPAAVALVALSLVAAPAGSALAASRGSVTATADASVLILAREDLGVAVGASVQSVSLRLRAAPAAEGRSAGAARSGGGEDPAAPGDAPAVLQLSGSPDTVYSASATLDISQAGPLDVRMERPTVDAGLAGIVPASGAQSLRYSARLNPGQPAPTPGRVGTLLALVNYN